MHVSERVINYSWNEAKDFDLSGVLQWETQKWLGEDDMENLPTNAEDEFHKFNIKSERVCRIHITFKNAAKK